MARTNIKLLQVKIQSYTLNYRSPFLHNSRFLLLELLSKLKYFISILAILTYSNMEKEELVVLQSTSHSSLRIIQRTA